VRIPGIDSDTKERATAETEIDRLRGDDVAAFRGCGTTRTRDQCKSESERDDEKTRNDVHETLTFRLRQLIRLGTRFSRA
jgi:hypothetical protein